MAVDPKNQRATCDTLAISYFLTGFYAFVILLTSSVLILLLKTLIQERYKIWEKQYHVFIIFWVGILLSFTIKMTLNSVSSVFSDPFSEVNEVFNYLIGPTLFAISELGYILVWLLTRRPDDMFEVINEKRCKLFLTINHLPSIGNRQEISIFQQHGSFCKKCFKNQNNNTNNNNNISIVDEN